MSFLPRLACRWRNGFFSIIVMFPSMLVTSMVSCKGAPVLLCLAIVLCDLHLPQGPDCLDACGLQPLTSRDWEDTHGLSRRSADDRSLPQVEGWWASSQKLNPPPGKSR